MSDLSKPSSFTCGKGTVPQNIDNNILSNGSNHSGDDKQQQQQHISNEKIKEISPKRRNIKNHEKFTNNNTSTNNSDDIDEEFEFFHEFKRKKVKDVIHHITSYLKQKAMDVEYLMIPFRPEQNNQKLLKFLNAIFPLGNGQPVNEKSQMKIISKTDVWTLFQSLKYIWCRLPNSEIVGWKAYYKFKYREIEKNYPQKAFLEIMPQCLESPNHASIVYDFFDLIVTLSSNSIVNKMSARKVSKMCALWAFGKSNTNSKNGNATDDNHSGTMSTKNNDSSEDSSYNFDANYSRLDKINNSFQDGLNEWIPASDAMFHLLLSFLKSFVPRDLESSKLPNSLKSILFNNEYPPKGSTAYTSQTILTIPLVTLYTDEFSRKPWQLLERCNELLDFSNYDAFEAREDYALLKSLFKKKNNVEGISRKMSQESRRLMKIMSTKHSTFQAGWAPRKCMNNNYDLRENIQIQRVDIDDYFIWTWLASLSYEETSEKKKVFGRSLILEFEFDGFKKWVVFEECDITLHYKRTSRLKRERLKEERNNKSDRETVDSEKGKPLPEIQNITPTHEQVQKDVPKQSVSKVNYSVLNGPSLTPQGQYHTVINRPSSHKNSKSNFLALEEKISKWNPLQNLRKKSNSIVSQKNEDASSSEVKKDFTTFKVYDQSQSRDKNNETYTEQFSNDMESNQKEKVTSKYSKLEAQKYKVPIIENVKEGSHIKSSNISNSSLEYPPNRKEFNTKEVLASYKVKKKQDKVDYQTPTEPPNIEQDSRNKERYHVNGIQAEANILLPQLTRTAEPVYTRTSMSNSTQNSTASRERHVATENLDEMTNVKTDKSFEENTGNGAVPSLEINNTLSECQTVLQNSTVHTNNVNYRQRINFNVHLDRKENGNFTDVQYGTENIDINRDNGITTPQSNNVYLDKTHEIRDKREPQYGQVKGAYRDNMYTTRQDGQVSGNCELLVPSTKETLESGRLPQTAQKQSNFNKSPNNIGQNYPNAKYEPSSLTQSNIYKQQRGRDYSKLSSTSPIKVQPQVPPQPYVDQNSKIVRFDGDLNQDSNYTNTDEPRNSGTRNPINVNTNNNFNCKGPQGNEYQQVPSNQMSSYGSQVQNLVYPQSNINGSQVPINHKNSNFAPNMMMGKVPIRGTSPNFNGPSPKSHMRQGVYENRERVPQIPMGVSNGMKPNLYPSSPYHHPNHLPVQNVNPPMNSNRSLQLDGYANYVHPMYGSSSSSNNNNNNINNNGNNNSYYGNGTMIPSDVPMAMPHNNVGMKLHRNNVNRKQERKVLYNNIRSGNFGI